MNLYSHLLKSYIRNEHWRRNVFTKIMFAIFILYFAIIFIVIGLKIDKILGQAGGNPIDKFNSFLLTYLVIDLVLRFFMKSLPTIEVQPYLRLPLRKTRIIKYLLFKTKKTADKFPRFL